MGIPEKKPKEWSNAHARKIKAEFYTWVYIHKAIQEMSIYKG